MSFAAPEEYRDGELLIRGLRPGDGAELNRATVASYEHLREFMEWARPDTTVEDSEGYVRLSRARWLAGEEWGFQLEGRLREHVPAVAGGGRRTTLLFGLVRSDPRPWRPGP